MFTSKKRLGTLVKQSSTVIRATEIPPCIGLIARFEIQTTGLVRIFGNLQADFAVLQSGICASLRQSVPGAGKL